MVRRKLLLVGLLFPLGCARPLSSPARTVEEGVADGPYVLWEGKEVAWQATSMTHFEKAGVGQYEISFFIFFALYPVSSSSSRLTHVSGFSPLSSLPLIVHGRLCRGA